MLNTARATRAIAVAPHHLAAQSALAVMREGGNAIEAMVAAAATIAVVYPHMNGIGGDCFWVIVPPKGDPIAIDGCGPAAAAATIDAYRSRGLDAIPVRGPLAANTVAGTVGGWNKALEIAAGLAAPGARPLPLARLLADAIVYATEGVAVTVSQESATRAKLPELQPQAYRCRLVPFLIELIIPQKRRRGSAQMRRRCPGHPRQRSRHAGDDDNASPFQVKQREHRKHDRHGNQRRSRNDDKHHVDQEADGNRNQRHCQPVFLRAQQSDDGIGKRHRAQREFLALVDVILDRDAVFGG